VVAPLVAALMGLATAKPPPTEAVLVTAGDALAMAFTGVGSAAADALLRRGGRLASRAGFDIGVKDDDDDEDEAEDDSGDAMEEDSPAATAEAAAAAAAIAAAIAAQPAARAAAQTKMLGALLGSSSLCVSPRAPERAAAAFGCWRSSAPPSLRTRACCAVTLRWRLVWASARLRSLSSSRMPPTRRRAPPAGASRWCTAAAMLPPAAPW